MSKLPQPFKAYTDNAKKKKKKREEKSSTKKKKKEKKSNTKYLYVSKLNTCVEHPE